MRTRTRMARAARTVAMALLLAAAAAAQDDWVIFKGQVNGPAAHPAIDLDTFKLRRSSGLFYTEGYYHHLNFPDGSMITVSIGFNRSETTIALVYGKPGMEPYKDFLIGDVDDAQADASGFGLTIGQNRVRLDGNTYTMDLALPQSHAKITFEILGPSYAYGDSMVRYPDGDTYLYYSLPIAWAKVTVDAVFGGKQIKLTGSGNINHDAGELFPTYTPSNWQVFWFFGDDHALAVTDHFTHEKFGRQLTQRLVFVTRDGRMFTSTSFDLKWDDWVDAPGIAFRYPRHFTLSADGGGDKLDGEVKMQETLLLEDLYSNLPDFLRKVVEYITPNGYTIDYWADYTLAYQHDGKTETYQGRGITRYTHLVEESK